jgi:hypothetical protein
VLVKVFVPALDRAEEESVSLVVVDGIVVPDERGALDG